MHSKCMIFYKIVLVIIWFVMTNTFLKVRMIWNTVSAAFFILLLVLPEAASAQKFKSVEKLVPAVDTLMAHSEYAKAFNICKTAISGGKMAVEPVYSRAALSGCGLMSDIADDYSGLIHLMGDVVDYAFMSESKDVIERTFRDLLRFCYSQDMDNTAMDYCDMATKYVNERDSLNFSFRGFLDYIRANIYQNQRDIGAAVNSFKSSVISFEMAGQYGQALNSSTRVLYQSPRIGTSRISMNFWNNSLDKYYQLAGNRNQLDEKLVRNYFIAKAYYYKYLNEYEEALKAWDSSVAAYKRYVALLPTKYKRYSVRNLDAYDYAYRIEFLHKLGRNSMIDSIADFASDTTDLVLNDLACLQYLLGKHYAECHNYPRAFSYLKQSYENYREEYGDYHQLTFKSLLLLLRYSIASGQYESGMQVAATCIRDIPKVFNPDESSSALELMEQTAALELLSHRYDSIERHLISAERIFSNMLVHNFGYLSDMAFNDLWSRTDIACSHLLQMAYELPDISPQLAKAVYKSVLTQKTLYFVSQNRLKKCAESSPENQMIYRNVSFLRKMISENKKDLPDHLLDSLYRVSKYYEGILYASDSTNSYLRRLLQAGFESVRPLLSDGDVVVEFSEVFEYDQELLDVMPEKCTYPYMAVAFNNKSEAPVIIKLFDKNNLGNYRLGNGVSLDQALRRRSPDDISAIYSDPALTKMIWGAVVDRFPDAKTFYFSPTGYLNGIALENMMDADGNIMSYKYNMVRIFSSAFFEESQRHDSIRNIALFGGINYGLGVDQQIATAGNYVSGDALRYCQRLPKGDTLRYQQLPSTYEECDYVRMRTEKVIDTYFHTGNDAVEESLKNYSGHSPSIIHVATHGYFNPQDSSANLLNMSGLVFAGANNWISGAELPDVIDDGILSALEISELDLSGTSLAVLSACETGLGFINSDGLFGLQRGFKLAGVKRVVMSLWDVADDATSLFMRRFYIYLLKGHTEREALEHARDYLRRGNRFSHPYYWAGFVLVE